MPIGSPTRASRSASPPSRTISSHMASVDGINARLITYKTRRCNHCAYMAGRRPAELLELAS